MKFFGSYTFDRGTGYSILDAWEGPKMFSATVTSETGEGFIRREVREKDPQRLFFRAMAIIKNLPGTKLVLVESEGEPFPWRVRTEEDEIRESVEEFKRTPHWAELRKNIAFGPRYQAGIGSTDGGDE